MDTVEKDKPTQERREFGINSSFIKLHSNLDMLRITPLFRDFVSCLRYLVLLL